MDSEIEYSPITPRYIKKLSCNICQKNFITKQKLKHHEIIHTGEKPFSCKECKKSFGREDSLKVHEKNLPRLQSLLQNL